MRGDGVEVEPLVSIAVCGASAAPNDPAGVILDIAGVSSSFAIRLLSRGGVFMLDVVDADSLANT
jgi:hypothetical protein